jgi:exopolyphosphatase/guanosine-5'-triphosphate,3'-diphosphate pyrophosphatase
VAREREMLHLGALVAQHGAIPDAARADAVAVVAHFTALAGSLGAEQRLAVATSALRDATNGPTVVAHKEIAADTTIRVIDGHEEGELAFAGVAASLGTATTPRLMLDLGGGSLELAVGTGHTVQRSRTLPLGVSRLSGMLREDPPAKGDVKALRQHVRDVLADAVDGLGLDEVTQVVAVGGTVRALARVAAARAGRWLPASLNLLRLERAQFKDLRKRLTRMDHSDRLDEPGMKSKRADHIHVAGTVVDTVLAELGVAQVVVSDWGLREGVLLEAVGIER